jgi:hypothetical protein
MLRRFVSACVSAGDGVHGTAGAGQPPATAVPPGLPTLHLSFLMSPFCFYWFTGDGVHGAAGS